jgi:hypothetical protein
MSEAPANLDHSNLDNLRINQRQLDDLTGLDISEVSMGWAYRQRAFHPSRRMAWLSEQLLTAGVALIFCVPVTLFLNRYFIRRHISYNKEKA